MMSQSIWRRTRGDRASLSGSRTMRLGSSLRAAHESPAFRGSFPRNSPTMLPDAPRAPRRKPKRASELPLLGSNQDSSAPESDPAPYTCAVFGGRSRRSTSVHGVLLTPDSRVSSRPAEISISRLGLISSDLFRKQYAGVSGLCKRQNFSQGASSNSVSGQITARDDRTRATRALVKNNCMPGGVERHHRETHHCGHDHQGAVQ